MILAHCEVAMLYKVNSYYLKDMGEKTAAFFENEIEKYKINFIDILKYTSKKPKPDLYESPETRIFSGFFGNCIFF